MNFVTVHRVTVDPRVKTVPLDIDVTLEEINIWELVHQITQLCVAIVTDILNNVIKLQANVIVVVTIPKDSTVIDVVKDTLATLVHQLVVARNAVAFVTVTVSSVIAELGDATIVGITLLEIIASDVPRVTTETRQLREDAIEDKTPNVNAMDTVKRVIQMVNVETVETTQLVSVVTNVKLVTMATLVRVKAVLRALVQLEPVAVAIVVAK